MRFTKLLLLAALVGTAACADDDGTTVHVEDAIRQGQGSTFALEPRSHPGIIQSIRLSTTTPRRGDTVTVESVLRSSGGPATVRVHTCMLGLQSAAGRDPDVHCLAGPMTRTIAPGDSVVMHGRLAITARRGSYDLGIVHLVDPYLMVRVPVTVRP